MTNTTTAVAADARQTLILGIGRELFAIDAGLVREILDPVPTTVVPGAKDFVPYVINVRGNVIPLIDLKVRFGLPPQEMTIDTRFVVIRPKIAGDWLNVACVADKVFEVAPLVQTSLADTTKMGLRLPSDLISGVGRWQDKVVLMPDLERILN
jgi:purine-binding chemotaxis protein CheW